MYIRRKVFSVAIDENGEEKLFSTTEIMSEDSYLEKAYAEAEAEKKSSTGKKVAIGAGATAAGTAGLAVGGSYGAGKLADRLAKNRTLKAVQEKNAIMKEAAKKASEEAAKWEGKKGVQADRVKEAIAAGHKKAAGVKVAEAGKVEQLAGKAGKLFKKIARK